MELVLIIILLIIGGTIGIIGGLAKKAGRGAESLFGWILSQMIPGMSAETGASIIGGAVALIVLLGLAALVVFH